MGIRWITLWYTKYNTNLNVKYMLKVKSFKMGDDAGMNELLSRCLIAEGATIMVSNGEIVIPYEDGKQLSDAQTKIVVQEDRNKIERKIHVINHSQKTIGNKINGVLLQVGKNEKVLEEAERVRIEGGGKKDTEEVKDHKKNVKDEITRLKNVIKQFEISMVNNQAELTNMVEDINVYNDDIEKLGSGRVGELQGREIENPHELGRGEIGV